MTALGAIARAAFNSYNRNGPNPFKTFDGRPVPPWEEIGPSVQGKWIAAVEGVLSKVGEALPRLNLNALVRLNGNDNPRNSYDPILHDPERAAWIRGYNVAIRDVMGHVDPDKDAAVAEHARLHGDRPAIEIIPSPRPEGT